MTEPLIVDWPEVGYLGGPLDGHVADPQPAGKGTPYWPVYRDNTGAPMLAPDGDRAILRAIRRGGSAEVYLLQVSPRGRFYVHGSFLPSFQLAQRHHALAS
ncbi:hypothetical protein [Pseudonocardia sp. N23]|uniref:hypothetical protein n=1 Tax=Pseudonocardia sp. N23 TaxID=1987376 RepID=UPI000BFDA89A|nr:hypothetical protein [Pseudonocardia sp. N23]GAY09830.1 hypothetical protein TOK_4185 [Pseudonocardia sp. N23]